MSCPGFDPLTNCTVSYTTQYAAQYAGMKFVCIFLPTAGIILGAILWCQHLKIFGGDVKYFYHINVHQAGILAIVTADILLIIFYSISPGYRPDLMSLLMWSAAVSGVSSSLLAGIWISIMHIGRNRACWKFSPMAVVAVSLISLYFVVVAIVFTISASTFGNMTTMRVLVGLLALMTCATAVLVAGLGSVVIRRLRVADQLRAGEPARVQRIWAFILIYCVAQIFCAVGQFVITFYQEEISTPGSRWIWLGVGYPGVLFSLAFFPVLLAFQRVDVDSMRMKRKSRSGSVVSSQRSEMDSVGAGVAL